MLRNIILFCSCLFQQAFIAQEKLIDSTACLEPNSGKKLAITFSSIGTIGTGGTIALWNVWYSDHSTGKFHFFNDASDWMMMDKIGHFYSTYQLTNYSTKAVRWAGLPNKNAIILGASIGMAFQTTLEIMDGFSSGWGFSWTDIASNSLGALLFSTQEILWKEQRILPKFSYHPTGYASIRPEILGQSTTERILKDYNGQTYWFSVSPGKFLKNDRFPEWICLSIGYSPDAKLVGNLNTYTDYSVNSYYTYYAKRQWLLSLDIDFRELPIKRKWLKSLVEPLNLLKIPFPTLIISNGKIGGNWMYF